MPAIIVAAITATKKKAGREDIKAVFQIEIFALDSG
jgi:hypothetical protein